MVSSATATKPAEQRNAAITGYLDRVTHEFVEGWIIDAAQPQRRLFVDIYLDDELVGRVRADMLRKDIAGHLGSDGRHAFRFDIRGRIPDMVGHTIRVFESETGYDFGKGQRVPRLAGVPTAKTENKDALTLRTLTKMYDLPEVSAAEITEMRKVGERTGFKVPKSFFMAISKDCNETIARQAFDNEMKGLGCPLYVATFDNAMVTQEAAIVTEQRSIISESCYPYIAKDLLAGFRNSFTEAPDGSVVLRNDKATRIDEEVVYLRERGEAGYFHWINSILPRLWLLEKAGIDPKLRYYIYAPSSFQQDSLKFIGIDASRMIPARPENVVFRRLHFPGPLIVGSSHWNRPREIMPFFDGLIDKATNGKTPKPTRLVYLSRSDAPVRRLMNEKETFARLQKHGFEFVTTTNMPFGDQVKLFASARAVISVHGAGLSNVAFMQPGTKVLEIVSPDRLWPTFRSLAVRRGLQYGCIVGDRVIPTGADQIAAGNNDFEVKPAVVDEAVAAILAD